MNNRAPLTSTRAKSIDDVGAGVVVSPIGSGQRELKDGDIYLTSPGYISPGGSLDPCSDLFYADELPLYTPPSALLLSVIPKSQQTAGVQRVTPRVCTGFREFRGSCQDYEINTSRVSRQSLLLLWQTDPCIVSTPEFYLERCIMETICIRIRLNSICELQIQNNHISFVSIILKMLV